MADIIQFNLQINRGISEALSIDQGTSVQLYIDQGRSYNIHIAQYLNTVSYLTRNPQFDPEL